MRIRGKIKNFVNIKKPRVYGKKPSCWKYNIVKFTRKVFSGLFSLGGVCFFAARGVFFCCVGGVFLLSVCTLLPLKMPTGVPFKRDIRELIQHHWELGRNAEEIFDILFMSDENRASLEYIEKLCRRFSKDIYFCHLYSHGPHPQRITRESQRLLSGEAVAAIMEIRETDILMSFRCLTRKFNLMWFGASTVNYVSLSTIRRHVIDRLRWSRKVLERRHELIDAETQLTFMEDMALREVNSFKDIDEMSICPADFHKRYGYAPVGSDALKTQIFIGTRSFISSIAMLWTAGIEAFEWIESETFDGSFCQYEM